MHNNGNALIIIGFISILISIEAYPLMVSKHGLLVTSLLFIYVLCVEFIIANLYEDNLIILHHNILRIRLFRIHALEFKLSVLLNNIGILSFLLSEAAIVEKNDHILKGLNAVNTNYGIVITTLWVSTIVSLLILRIHFNEMVLNRDYRLDHNHE